jgi:hypothetical protein
LILGGIPRRFESEIEALEDLRLYCGEKEIGTSFREFV